METRKKKLLKVGQYGFYGLVFFMLYILQNTPDFLSVGGIKPILLIPAAITLAMYEGEFIGGLYGAFAGLLCDIESSFLFGFDGIFTLVFCVGSGLLVLYLLQQKVVSSLILTGGAMSIRCLLVFVFAYGIWGYENLEQLFLQETIWKILYSTAFAPLFFVMWKHICSFFWERENN